MGEAHRIMPDLRLTTGGTFYDWQDGVNYRCRVNVWLDNEPIKEFEGKNDREARAVAEAYIADLLAHFRGGGQ
jgi:hypothetical protein